MAKEIIIATKNPGKAKEFASLFEPKGYTVKTLLDYPDIPDIEEPYDTFVENARIKARTIADLFQTVVLADDSGLSVDALDGAPGVLSARYAGEPKSDDRNNQKLLQALEGVPTEERQANFHCAIVVCAPHSKVKDLEALGTWQGVILDELRGDNGFGYDPLFFLPELNKTCAELSNDVKNEISHRGQAIKTLWTSLDEWLEVVEED